MGKRNSSYKLRSGFLRLRPSASASARQCVFLFTYVRTYWGTYVRKIEVAAATGGVQHQEWPDVRLYAALLHRPGTRRKTRTPAQSRRKLRPYGLISVSAKFRYHADLQDVRTYYGCRQDIRDWRLPVGETVGNPKSYENYHHRCPVF